MKRWGISADIKNSTIYIDSISYKLEPIYNDKLIQAISDGRVVILENDLVINERKILYYCARKVLCKEDSYNRKHYLDVVVYNEKMDTFVNGYCNRSLGHENDICENEIHQVLQGKIGELILWEGEKYWGIFSEGEYVEIPCGAYHCTYVLEKNTIVANVYSNIFWENDLKLKPYFTVVNNISVIMEQNVYYLCDGKFTIEIDDERTLVSNGFNDCRSIMKECYYSTRHDLRQSILKLIK